MEMAGTVLKCPNTVFCTRAKNMKKTDTISHYKNYRPFLDPANPALSQGSINQAMAHWVSVWRDSYLPMVPNATSHAKLGTH